MGENVLQNTTTKLSGQDNLTIWMLLISGFVVILNETVMSVALPVLMREMHVDASTGQWLTTAFLLTMSVVIPITGTLIRRFATRFLYFVAMAAFMFGTILCAAAPVFEVLLAGRIVQATGTAITMPLLITTTISVVPAAIRGRIMGRISIVISVAPAIGPTASGFILQYFTWRWLFLFMLPIVLVAVIVSFYMLCNVGENTRVKIDLISVGFSAIGFGSVVYGLNSFGSHAATAGVSALPAVVLVTGFAALAVFIWRQLRLQKTDSALLDLRVFRYRTYSVSVIIISISMMAMFGIIVLLPIFAQNVLEMQTLEIGLLLLPGGLIMGLVANPVGRAVDKYGARLVMFPGVLMTSVAMWGFALLTQNSPAWYLLLCHIVLSVGLALTFTPIFSSSMGILPKYLISHGSAILSTMQQVAGAAGTALLVAIFAAVAGGSASAQTNPEQVAAGASAAFIVGACIVTLVIVAWFYLPKREAAVAG
ncbi:DHA2 family efflux MFS transporter permease subunit [Canibacter sp. lx-45]|nr:DHA2 family efflux MFS transporter permease subunit [Canibacter zhuwentaonis]